MIYNPWLWIIHGIDININKIDININKIDAQESSPIPQTSLWVCPSHKKDSILSNHLNDLKY